MGLARWHCRHRAFPGSISSETLHDALRKTLVPDHPATRRGHENSQPRSGHHRCLHLIETRKLAYSSFNQAVCALRFLYTHTVRVPWPVTMVPFGKRPKRLPTVLSRQAVDELLRCIENLKHRTFFSTLYACGMRISEVAHWHVHALVPGGGPSS